MFDACDNGLVTEETHTHTHTPTYIYIYKHSWLSHLKCSRAYLVGLLTSVLVKLQRSFIDLVPGPHSFAIYCCGREKQRVLAFKEDH